MKKYLSILTLAVTVLLSSCSDSLDRFPIDQLVEETAYRTVGDLQLGLAGAIGNYNPNNFVEFNSIFTDNCALGVDNGGQELNTLNQILNADGGDRGIWTSHYSTLNDFNRLLAAAAGISPTTAEVAQYNNILAQTYAFRALIHYDLLLYYGLDIRDNTSLGVPYVDYVSADATPARNTTGEVLTAIEADLNQALALFPSGTTDINYATPDFVTFLRARIALETGDNQGAIGFATNIINNYPLATAGQYFNMFNEDADTTEVIWKYDSVQGFNLGLNFIWNFTGPGPFIEMSNELAGLYESTDIRRSVNIDPASTPDDDIFIIGKYPINADTQAINDFKAMRVSEAYLIRAEAYAKTTQFGLAAGDVSAVRTIRNPAATVSPYGTLGQAIDDIIAERRLELSFEGHRYNDIKRVRAITNDGITRDASDCEGAVPCDLAITSEKWIFPIPTTEINANPVIAAQQAPNY
ncbi:SusD family protein [Formosa sp. Hel1_31_208]|uniref:RagB/SusD family nutrient uptake outer membrane protein n=1 Tax=Formosa sp. Hel1_31_208 TaxID=1798225 RepID=UPI00087D77FA|nr:RagB/SusD family nutrient uptake outer membrane protein [Formosa sp. Hel1_31_208]SDR65625.1 SusD family protein [Formosa sp. Hel1_31_208]